MQSAVAIPSTPATPGSKRNVGAGGAEGETPVAKRPAIPEPAAMEVSEPQTRSNADISRGMLQVESRVLAIEKWILTNNDVLTDHADKIDRGKLLTMQVASDIGNVVKQQATEIAEVRASLVASQAVLEANDLALKSLMADTDRKSRSSS